MNLKKFVSCIMASAIAVGGLATGNLVIPEVTALNSSNAIELPIIPIGTTTAVTTSANTTETTVATENALFCSPDGNGSGTKDSPMSVDSALSKLKSNPGMTVFLLGGTYNFSKTIKIEADNSGSDKGYNTIMAYPGEEVVWDFSSLSVSDSNRGVVLDGSYWYFKGFEIKGAGDNGMLLSGNNNKIEMMVFNDNQDSGLQISRYRSECNSIATWPSNNLILNCSAKNNCDNKTMENADGFAAKLTCGEGNVFDGCMSYNNSDDGWDLYAKQATGPIGVITIKNCIAFRNGYTEFGEGYGDCDGNGFKLGGDGVGTAHIVENCLAFENLNCGFTDNNNPKLESIKNCTAYNNSVGANGKPNFSVYRCTDDGCDFSEIISYINEAELKKALAPGVSLKLANDKFVGTMENAVYYGGKYYSVAGKENIGNGDKIGTVVTVSDSDFISLSAPAMGSDFHKLWRNADGTLNTGGFAETKEESTYAYLGIDFGSGETPVVTTTAVTTTVPTTETTVATTASDTGTATTKTDVSTTTSDAGTATTKTDVSTTTSDTSTSTIKTDVSTTTTTEQTTPSETVDMSKVKYGDVNVDGSITTSDIVALNKYLVNKQSYALKNAVAMENADCVKDGDITQEDSMAIINFCLQKITESALGVGK